MSTKMYLGIALSVVMALKVLRTGLVSLATESENSSALQALEAARCVLDTLETALRMLLASTTAKTTLQNTVGQASQLTLF